jgi:hypothetical protein
MTIKVYGNVKCKLLTTYLFEILYSVLQAILLVQQNKLSRLKTQHYKQQKGRIKTVQLTSNLSNHRTRKLLSYLTKLSDSAFV